MERNVIAIVGIHGSGKSRLAKNITQELQSTHSIDHLGVGDTIRKIGRGVIESCRSEEIRSHLNSSHARHLIDDEIMYDVMSEAFSAYRGSDTILIDGFPRTSAQAEQLDTLSVLNACKIAGFIKTDTSDADAIMRMLRRGPRDYEGFLMATDASERITQDRKHYDELNLPQHFPSLPIKIIDTSGAKEETTSVGLYTVKDMLRLSDTL